MKSYATASMNEV